MTTNVKTISRVGYLLVDMLRFWHSTVDCVSFGFFPEFLLLLRVLVPFWLLASRIGRLQWWWGWELWLGSL